MTTLTDTPSADLAADDPDRFDEHFKNKEDDLRWYREMLRIRRFEELAGRAYTRGKISGFLHLAIGQEAIAVATKEVLRSKDCVVSAYRSHGFAIAFGSSPGACMAELYGKATGLVGGIGGSMHFFDRERQLWGGYAIVGNQVPVAAGHAFAAKYKGEDAVTFCFLGDGALAIGPTHEGWTLAGLWRLPIVFVVENNGYSMGTPLERSIPVTDITLKAPGYNMESDRFRVTNVAETAARLGEAARLAREEHRPVLVELLTYRFRGHSMSDPAKYRGKEEVETWRRWDPLERTQRALVKHHGISEEALEELDDAVVSEMEEAVTFAEDSPQPAPEVRFRNILVEE